MFTFSRASTVLRYIPLHLAITVIRQASALHYAARHGLARVAELEATNAAQSSELEGRRALWGATCVFLELLDHSPLAQRALKGWERLAVTTEGGPIPWAGIAALINWFREHNEAEAAVIGAAPHHQLAVLREARRVDLAAREAARRERAPRRRLVQQSNV